MSFDEFCAECYREMVQYAKETYDTELRLEEAEVAGRRGPLVCLKNDASVQPSIHFSKVWNSMEAPECAEVKAVAARLVDSLVKESQIPDELKASVYSVLNKESVLEQLFVKVVNANTYPNLDMTIHWRFIDLAAVVCVRFDMGAEGFASSVVTRPLLNFLKVDAETILQRAKDSLCQQYLLENLTEIFNGVCDFRHPSDPLMYVVTNKERMFGASGMLNRGVLDKAANVLNTETLCVIPSSVHEVLIVDSEGIECEEVSAMVREVNQTIQADEVLSDHVYLYDKSTGVLSWNEEMVQL